LIVKGLLLSCRVDGAHATRSFAVAVILLQTRRGWQGARRRGDLKKLCDLKTGAADAVLITMSAAPVIV
jgi:hypothetical protein